MGLPIPIGVGDKSLGPDLNSMNPNTQQRYSHMPLFTMCKTARGFKLQADAKKSKFNYWTILIYRYPVSWKNPHCDVSNLHIPTDQTKR
jgi:hypothetical protein